MKSKTFKQFVAMNDKTGNLIELSKYKKELPEEYATYNAAYKKALDEVQKAHNRHVAGYTGCDYMKKENILAQAAFDSTIPHPELTFEASRELEESRQRVKDGNYTSEDLARINAYCK